MSTQTLPTPHTRPLLLLVGGVGRCERAYAQAAAQARCFVCGCTEEYACPGGCSWADAAALVPDWADRELCSRCAEILKEAQEAALAKARLEGPLQQAVVELGLAVQEIALKNTPAPSERATRPSPPAIEQDAPLKIAPLPIGHKAQYISTAEGPAGGWVEVTHEKWGRYAWRILRLFTGRRTRMMKGTCRGLGGALAAAALCCGFTPEQAGWHPCEGRRRGPRKAVRTAILFTAAATLGKDTP